MSAAIAHMGGHDVASDETKALQGMSYAAA
jgi:hypothetical protein